MNRNHNRSTVANMMESMESRTLLSWGTADDWSYPNASTLGSTPRSLASDANGAVYAAGSAWGANNIQHGIIRKMDPATGVSQVVDDWATSGHTRYTSIAVAPNGTLYAGGSAVIGGSNHWILRASTDGGATWTVKDDYQLAPGNTATLQDIDVDAQNNVFTVGSAHNGTKVGKVLAQYWIVRKLNAITGQSSTLRNYNETGFAHATAIEVSSSGIYVVGSRGNEGAGAMAWVTQQSTDGGANWANVDVYKPASTLNAVPHDIASDAAGNVFAVGLNTTTNGLNGSAAKKYWNWTVRRSTSGGAWSTVDSYRRAEADSNAKSIAIDSNGNIFVGGTGKDATGAHAMVRTAPAGGAAGSWAISDDFQRTAGASSFNTSLCVDPSNNVYAGVEGRDSAGTNHWVVRKFTPDVPPPAPAPAFSTTPIAGTSDVATFAETAEPVFA